MGLAAAGLAGLTGQCLVPVGRRDSLPPFHPSTFSLRWPDCVSPISGPLSLAALSHFMRLTFAADPGARKGQSHVVFAKEGDPRLPAKTTIIITSIFFFFFFLFLVFLCFPSKNKNKKYFFFFFFFFFFPPTGARLSPLSSSRLPL